MVARDSFKHPFTSHKKTETARNQTYLAPNRGALGCCTHTQTLGSPGGVRTLVQSTSWRKM